MNATEFLAKWKAHLIFACVVPLVIAFNSAINIANGQSLQGAIFHAIGEITPMEYAMVGLVWYACAFRRSGDDWYTPLTTLNLGRSDR